MEAADVSLLSGEVPADADVVAIVGPTRAYTESEITALEAFLDRGGRLLVALDPLIEPAGTMRPTRLEEMLATRGVSVNDDLVVDPSRRLPFYDLSAVYLEDFPSHPVTSGLEGFAVLFTVARSLTRTMARPGPWSGPRTRGGVRPISACCCGANRWHWTSGDTAGPAVVAVAVKVRAAGAEADEAVGSPSPRPTVWSSSAIPTS